MSIPYILDFYMEVCGMVRKYTASLFMNGGSQAVRLPKECRFEGSSVRVWKEGSRVIIEPVEKRAWSPGFWERMDAMAAEIDIEVPERLPSSEHRYAIFDEDDVA
jgi:antitoxin VapB